MLLGLFATVTVMTSCDKTKPYDILETEPQAHFVGARNQAYTITTNPPPAYTITIGTTDVSDVDREVSYAVTASAGAVAGTDFTISPAGKVVIPAGKATATLTVQANYSSYINGEKDTLRFVIVEPSVKAADFMDTIFLSMRGPCAEVELTQGNITTNLAAFNGAFQARENGWNANNSVAYANYGPYAVSVSNITRTGNTATFRLANIYEVTGWTGTFTLDFTDPNSANWKTTLTSNIVGPGSLVGLAAYNIAVEPVANPATPPVDGTFKFCTQTITVRFHLAAYSVATGAFAGYLTASTGGGAGTFSMVLTR